MEFDMGYYFLEKEKENLYFISEVSIHRSEIPTGRFIT